MAGKALKGKGTKIRWAILATANAPRPATGALNLITGMQSSEIKGGQELDAAPAGDYESASDQGNWRDGDSVRQVSWTFSLSGHVKEDAAQAAQLEALWQAWSEGKTIYVERLRPGDTKWRGGRALIQDPTEPVPHDGEITFSCSFLGQGELIKTDAAANP